MDKKLTLNIGLTSVISVLLAFALGFALSWWSPWGGSDRTVTVTGESTLAAEPDEYIFNPYYQATADNRTEATTAARDMGDKVVAKLKELGVDDSKIKTDITAYDFSVKPIDTAQTDNEFQATYSLTVTISNEELAQKVFDYLLTTKSLGAVSPQVGFSEDTRARLKSEARKAAVANARTQADEIAAELDQRITKAISVEEVTGFDVIPIYGYGVAEDRAVTGSAGGSQTDIMPGEQDLVFTIKVIYGLR